ncbi:MAG TPA: hypothetical protein VKR55_31910 [Bradyrhizobium sp.]|uniref:hypothetical protein n=1 Tax=Bradyrhizobium sp. TaxID=376 RepID=UPI002CFF3EAF|nr:hypothetical protein [Bradyrhizobium sp.]HLZ06739.1 hypothetical protein [Bradyrhizobium sp.]
MSDVVRIAAPIRSSTASSRQSKQSDFVPVAIFSGIGLLVSLIAVLTGVQGVWF